MRVLTMIARRCLWMPPTLFGLLLIVFTVSHIIPADPARVMAGENRPSGPVPRRPHHVPFCFPPPGQILYYLLARITAAYRLTPFSPRSRAESMFARRA